MLEHGSLDPESNAPTNRPPQLPVFLTNKYIISTGFCAFLLESNIFKPFPPWHRDLIHCTLYKRPKALSTYPVGSISAALSWVHFPEQRLVIEPTDPGKKYIPMLQVKANENQELSGIFPFGISILHFLPAATTLSTNLLFWLKRENPRDLWSAPPLVSTYFGRSGLFARADWSIFAQNIMVIPSLHIFGSLIHFPLKVNTD